MARIRVKMCGTTSLEDALFAVECGVDALGFIFYPKSPRNISFTEAASIIRRLPFFIDRVGVFVNSPVETGMEGVAQGLSVIQLHGNETPDFCRKVKERATHCRVLKAFRVNSSSSSGDFEEYCGSVDGYLLDTYVKGAEGGTGKVFDWSVIPDLGLKEPYLLAGGLTPYNIRQAVREVAPYGVDVNSGVESFPGKKDHADLKKFMDEVRDASLLS